jgi:indole-3-glycerol phosphate synthase
MFDRSFQMASDAGRERGRVVPARDDDGTLTEQRPKVKPGSFLDRTVARKRGEIEAARRDRPLETLVARARDRSPARPWREALRDRAVIAEIKRASPSAGRIDPRVGAADRARLFERHGASAISVLTDRAFDGRLEDLEAVVDTISIPVLRKDFIVDPWQVWETRAAGADAALVIVAAVDDDGLRGLARAADEAGLALLVEVHSEADVARALDLGAEVVGVNARDLQSLEVDVESGLALLAGLRRATPGATLVAESGIAGPADVRRAHAAGADAVLVGEHLARASDPGAALSALVAS